MKRKTETCRFDCPECGERDVPIEEVLGNATVYTHIRWFETREDEDGKFAGRMVRYKGEPSIEDGVLMGYQCSACGTRIVDCEGIDLGGENELYEWLKARGMLL